MMFLKPVLFRRLRAVSSTHHPERLLTHADRTGEKHVDGRWIEVALGTSLMIARIMHCPSCGRWLAVGMQHVLCFPVARYGPLGSMPPVEMITVFFPFSRHRERHPGEFFHPDGVDSAIGFGASLQ